MTSQDQIAAIVLTFNEEINIRPCLESLKGAVDEIFVLDSFSSDGTCQIARQYTSHVFQNKFVGYSQQRNWGLKHLPIQAKWVFWIDADERVSKQLASSLKTISKIKNEFIGYYVKRRLVFMGKSIRWGGYYPVKLLRLFKKESGRCETRRVNEHFLVTGPIGMLEGDLIHEDKKDLSVWIKKHKKYALLEAQELVDAKRKSKIKKMDKLVGEASLKRILRERVWNYLPPFLRSFLYFFVRFFLLLGFLDGFRGLIFHLLQGLWYPLLIDVKYLRLLYQSRKEMGSEQTVQKIDTESIKQ